MKKKNLDFKGAVGSFLDAHKADPKVKARWLKSDNATVEAFNSTMKVLEKRQEQAEARMKLKKQADAMQKKLH
jgi:hypothetical protein